MNSKRQTKPNSEADKSINLIIDPPITMDWLPQEKKDKNIMIFGFDADMTKNKSLRVDLNVAFTPIPVRRGKITRRTDFHIGSTGATIKVKTNNSTLKNYSKEKTLKVKYSNTTKRKRNFTFTLKPEVTAKSGDVQIGASIGSVTREKGDERTFSTAFSNKERKLATTALNNTITWSIELPRGDKAIRDFLIGNLYLYAQFTCGSSPISGRVAIRPTNVLFFDEENIQIGKLHSFYMQYVLWRKGIKLMNLDGVQIKFKEIRR